MGNTVRWGCRTSGTAYHRTSESTTSTTTTMAMTTTEAATTTTVTPKQINEKDELKETGGG